MCSKCQFDLLLVQNCVHRWRPFHVICLLSHVRFMCHPFQVIPMDENHFFSFKDIANNLLNTTKLPISTCSMIKVSSLTPEKVYYKKTFSDEEHWKDFHVFKRNATTEQLKNQKLIPIPKPTLSSEKKKDLLAMIPFLPEEHKNFYKNITS